MIYYSNMKTTIMMNRVFILILFLYFHCLASSSDLEHHQQEQAYPSEVIPSKLEFDSFKAIRTLHNKLDIDADGEVDDLESKNFLESDKIKVNDNNAGAYSTAHKLRYLHQDGKDRSISVDELWEAWKCSHVHNWTVDETVYWLVNYVELPEYSQLFIEHSVNGTLLPRLAADSQFVTKLGITDPSAKNKISIKAMDVVLFGPPKLGSTSKARDIIVALVIAIAISLCYVFYSRLCASQKTLSDMKNSLETLQKAEDQMLELQQELNKALKVQEAVVTEKKNLEHQLEMQRQFSASNLSDQSKTSANIHDRHNPNGDTTATVGASNTTPSQEREKEAYVAKLEKELKNLRHELQVSCDALAAKKFLAPIQLRALLQATYRIESQYYNEKKLSLESKASEVKQRNQKLQKKKTSFLGYYKMAQENSLEEDINTTVELKEAIIQVTREIKERSERWRRIEELCNCSLDLTHR